MKLVLAILISISPAALAQSTVTGNRTVQGNWDASGATATKPAKAGATLPATCSLGEFFFNTSVTNGQNIYLCNPSNSWSQATAGAVAFTNLSGTAAPAQIPLNVRARAIGATFSGGGAP